MKKIATKVLLIGAALLFCSACANTTKSANTTVQEVQDALPVVVDHLNAIQTQEAGLQENWEDDINADASLSSYTKKQGRVFENIQARRDLQKQITTALKTIRDNARRLSNLKDTKLPSVEIQVVVSNLNTIVDQLTKYQQLSDAQLKAEESFFVSISGNPFTPTELKNKIIELNSSALERQGILESINDPLSAIDKPIRILKARLGSQTEGSE